MHGEVKLSNRGVVVIFQKKKIVLIGLLKLGIVAYDRKGYDPRAENYVTVGRKYVVLCDFFKASHAFWEKRNAKNM